MSFGHGLLESDNLAIWYNIVRPAELSSRSFPSYVLIGSSRIQAKAGALLF